MNTVKTEDALISKALTILGGIQTGDRSGLTFINPDHYPQHNLGVADGADGFRQLLDKTPPNTVMVSIIRAFRDGDVVFTHTEYAFPGGPEIGFDVFRFGEDGLAAEHWDNLQPKTPNYSSSALSADLRTQISGPVDIVDLDQTEANKAYVRKFVEETHIQADLDQLESYFNGDVFIQHDPRLPDGVANLRKALEANAQPGAAAKGKILKDIKYVYGQGNWVLLIAPGTFAGDDAAFYDLFRLEHGKIAEHWDTIETIPPRDQWKNPHGKF
jgi:predicted SnoaL-like aldol condensation-catalyzing enzyme